MTHSFDLIQTMKPIQGYLVGCPKCRTDALYRYGKAWTGKQRYLCLTCGRQFTIGATRHEWKDKPPCPVCGKGMHFYQKDARFLRFRCSAYPDCRQYLKVEIQEEKPNTQGIIDGKNQGSFYVCPQQCQESNG